MSFQREKPQPLMLDNYIDLFQYQIVVKVFTDTLFALNVAVYPYLIQLQFSLIFQEKIANRC